MKRFRFLTDFHFNFSSSKNETCVWQRVSWGATENSTHWRTRKSTEEIPPAIVKVNWEVNHDFPPVITVFIASRVPKEENQ